MNHPNSKHVKPIFRQRSCLVKAYHIKLASNIDSIQYLSEHGPQGGKSLREYLCGLIQNICCLLSRDKAKFVPIVRVAGRAGGTTMVIRSRARIMIRCQANWRFWSARSDCTLTSFVVPYT